MKNVPKFKKLVMKLKLINWLKPQPKQAQNEAVNQSNLQIRIAELESELHLAYDANNELVSQVDKLTQQIVKLHGQLDRVKDIKQLEAKIQNRDECYAALLDWSINTIGKEVTFDPNATKQYWIDQIK